VITIENLSKCYGDLWAVRDLNLEIPRGELFAFLGPNGAGKTTTIKTICGLLRPTHGRILIGGADVQTETVEAVRRIGYIPDHPYLYEKLTGQELLDFVGDLHHVPRPRRSRRIQQLLEMFGIEHWRHHLVQEYSHGMRQKLVFAASLLHDPDVLVVDEPMVGLDPKGAKLVKDIFLEQVRRGATIFLSTHTLPLAEELANRIGLIRNGQLIFLGTLSEMRTQTQKDGSLEQLFLKLTDEQQKEDTRSASEWLDLLQKD